MTKKIDIIDNCHDCSDRYFEDNFLYCKLKDELIDDGYYSIPDWCPKEDYIEEK